jgi:serine/threonine protein kinase
MTSQSSAVPSLRDGSFSVGDFKHTESVNLRSDSRGNTFLNQYVVIKDLGQGAFGKVRCVSRATCPPHPAFALDSLSPFPVPPGTCHPQVKLCLNSTSNRLCALKCINRKTMRRKYAAQGRFKGREAVKKEIAIMKKLVHENVVRLYEVIDDEVGQYIFLVLEYVPGGPIYAPAKFHHKGMGEDLAHHYFRETCRGLDFLHVNNVVHRDLKPDNLLKKTDGTVKITDFGVSELFSEDDDDGLEVSNAVGTPAFLAPEIANGGAVAFSRA